MAYEDLIFSGLSFVLLLLIGFCLGVERGKRLMADPAQMVSMVPPQPKPIDLSLSMNRGSVPDLVRAATSHSILSDRQGTESSGGLYAIQLASYLDSKVAQEEVQHLRQRGFDARVVKQGKYYELRVVGYRARAEAMNALPLLRKTYQDGFIKRLSSSG